MARIDPNQAAAAVVGTPIPGADPLGQPVIDMQTPAPSSSGAPSDADIATAEALGLNPNAMGADEWDFVRVFQAGGLASLAADGDPENPLIPGEDAPVAGTPIPPQVPTTQPTVDAPPPTAGADDRVGPATTPEGGAPQVIDDPQPVAPSPTDPETLETPGRPAFQIPSTLPPAVEVPEPQQPAPLQPNLVQLPDGSVVTVETYQALIAAQQQQQPFAQQQPTPPYVAPPTSAPPAPMTPPGYVPNAWSSTPGEYVDERAQYEIEVMRAQQAQMAAQMAAMVEMQQANTKQSIDVAVEETLQGYAGARQITYEQADDLLQQAVRLGLVGVYSQQFPGDPRRAVAAAVENVYWNTPEYRRLEAQRELEAERVQNEETERKKAFAGQTTGTPGSAPRTAAPANTPEGRTQGMVAMIEADSAYQAQQAQRR